MINLIQNTAQLILNEHGGNTTYCGQLSAPDSGYDVSKAVALGMRWAMDNGCFKRYEPEKIIRMMRKNHGIAGCLFMVAPDVVQNHDETLLLFRAWLGTIQSFGYPVAFVIQNGATVHNIPWGSLDCIFIGGDNAYKYSQDVCEIIKEALKRGKWIHAGRVSTIRRIRYFRALGCHSFDSSGYSRFMRSMVSRTKAHYTNDRQLLLI
jgi:hypothetical protein